MHSKTRLYLTAIAMVAAAAANSPLLANQTWQDNFTNGQPANSGQCSNWNTFRLGLTGTYTSVTMSGTFDQPGITCNDATLTAQIATMLLNWTTNSIVCNGHTWHFCAFAGPPNGFFDFWIDPPSSCAGNDCPNPGRIIRPCIGNTNFGGLNTATCNPPTQTMKLDFVEAAGNTCDLTPIESKLDDGSRWVSDAENNAQTTTINNNTNTGITNVRTDVGRIESKLDDGSRWVSDAENNTQTTTINNNTNTGVTNIRGDITLLESKLDGIDLGTLDSALADIKSDIALVESKLDDETRFSDDTELGSQTTTINNNTNTGITNVRTDVGRIESKLDDGSRWVSDAENNTQTTTINNNTNTGVTNIRADIALVESKLDLVDTAGITALESKLDDESRFTDDTELNAAVTSINNNVDAAETSINNNVDAAETSINNNVDAAETSINNNIDTAETNIRADVALVESKLDDEVRFTDDTELAVISGDIALIESKLDVKAQDISNLESKLDDETRYTDDTEFQAGVDSINNNVDAAETSINNNVDAAETSINNNVDAAETSINNNVDTAETNIRADVALVESKLDALATDELAQLESKLDDETRYTDDTEFDAGVTSINNNVDAAETSINNNVDTAETNIRADVALVESKLDALATDELAQLESKLDDETRYTDDTEFDAGVTSINNNVDAAETSINNNVDAAETSINNNVDTAETNIRADVALVESKLDALATDELAQLESKLDDETRYTDDTEFNAGVTSINNNVDAAETSINNNVDAAETSINNNVDAAETSINNNIDTAETNVRADVALVESKLDGLAADELAQLESKLDDSSRFTDDTEQGAQTTTIVTEIDENQTILEDAKSEIMLLESKLDGLQTQVSTLTCVIIDLLLTPEEERCSDTAECGFGAFPSGLDNLPTPAACQAPSSGNVRAAGTAKAQAGNSKPADVAAVAVVAPSVDMAALESLVSEATEAAARLHWQSRTFISSALRSDDVDPLLLLSEEQGGLFDQVAALVRDSLGLYRGMKLDPVQLAAAEEAFAEAERLRVEGSRVASYRLYRTAYRELLAISSQINK